MADKNSIVPAKPIESLILVIRGQRVMLDADLAALYGVSTKVFNQAVKRNLNRFPEDFMFQLSKQEAESLRSQIATSRKLMTPPKADPKPIGFAAPKKN